MNVLDIYINEAKIDSDSVLTYLFIFIWRGGKGRWGIWGDWGNAVRGLVLML